MADNWYAGNANDDAGQHRGWLLGHFINRAAGAARATATLEVKWGIHPAGDQRAGWTSEEQRSTLVLLVSGKFRVDLSVGTITMERQGDYITWGPRHRPLLAGRRRLRRHHRPMAIHSWRLRLRSLHRHA